MQALRIRTVGDSVGVILPDDVLVELGINRDDTELYAWDAPDGILLSSSLAAFEVKIDLVRTLMRKHRAVLRGLAM